MGILLCFSSGQQIIFDRLPELQARLGEDEYPQRGSDRSSIEVIVGVYQGRIVRRCSRPFVHGSWRSCKQLLVESFVFLCAYGVAERIAEDGVNFAFRRTWWRRGVWILRCHWGVSSVDESEH